MAQGSAKKIDGNQLFKPNSGFEASQSQRDGYENYWMWPDELGSGFLYMIKLRPGLTLGIGNFFLNQEIEVVTEMDNGPICMGFGVTGRVNYAISHAQGQSQFHHYHGFRSITHLPRCLSITRPVAGMQVRYINLLITPSLLRELLGGQREHIPVGMRELIEGDLDPRYYHDFTSTAPAAKVTIHQILNCPYCNPLKKIYFESKALELIAHVMEPLTNHHPQAPALPGLRPHDLERVRRAKELVKNDYKNPPNLLALSRAVGLSHPKLNSCFREAYGTTIFGYIRRMRLDKAKHLLDEGQMNVTEVAYEVGYSSLSHFAKVFKEHFGVAPGDYLRKVSHHGANLAGPAQP